MNNSLTTKGSYNKYHTLFKIAIQQNLVPADIQNTVPTSNSHRWKNTSFDSYIGSNLIDDFTDNLVLVQELLKYKLALKAAYAFIRIKNVIIKIITYSTSAKTLPDKIKQSVINTINRVKPILGYTKAVRYLNISKGKLTYWKQTLENKCTVSAVGKCVKIWPNQLTKLEINVIKEYFNDKQYQGWSIFARAYHALKTGTLYACLNTWYKYVKLLHLCIRTPNSRRKNHDIGIRARKPLEKLHADVTIFRPINNVKVYIYIIMDNFSRCILGWKASTKLSADIFVVNLKGVYEKHIKKNNEQTELIVDGGSENNNSKVDDFLITTNDDLKKLIAQKDIIFSNSMIEAGNKTLKYRGLFLHEIPDYESTVRHLEKIIPTYNKIIPHSALNGLTPDEALAGKEFKKEKYNKFSLTARRKRKKFNQKVFCPICV